MLLPFCKHMIDYARHVFHSLTGVSPFAGENDRSSVLNIRNYNVAFEESMFADLCPEAKGFVIKLLVADKV